MREPQVVGQTTSVSRFFVSRIETHKSVGQDMSTLINEPFHEEEATSSCVGMTPYTFPKAENTQTGESVDYVPSSDKQWYVLRASFGREENVSQYLTADGTYNYVARRYTWIADRHGHPRQHLESLLPSILFAYATRQKVEQYVRHTPTLPYITYYYDHFRVEVDYRNPPLVIPNGQMENFIRATYNHDEHLRLVQPGQCRFKDNQIVQVIAGPLKGVIGRIARISRQSCLVVSLPNIGLFSTAYIPSWQLSPVEINM